MRLPLAEHLCQSGAAPPGLEIPCGLSAKDRECLQFKTCSQGKEPLRARRKQILWPFQIPGRSEKMPMFRVAGEIKDA